MKYKAIIFDMDGTIIDTENIWKEAAIELIEDKGKSITPELKDEIYKRIHGLQLHEACAIIKELANLEDSLDCLVKYKCIIADRLYEEGITFIDGFTEFHKELVARKLKSAIATNANKKTLEITNKILNLKRFFGNHMYCIDDIDYKGKPEPDIYLYTAKKLEVDPQECIAIEDSTPGIEAAQRAGMFCIGINTAHNRKSIEQADLIIEGYKDIDLNALLGSR